MSDLFYGIVGLVVVLVFVALCAAAVVGLFLVGASVLMVLWNLTFPALLHGPRIDMLPACGLLFLLALFVWIVRA